jgi:hypothetical protein
VPRIFKKLPSEEIIEVDDQLKFDVATLSRITFYGRELK